MTQEIEKIARGLTDGDQPIPLLDQTNLEAPILIVRQRDARTKVRHPHPLIEGNQQP